MVHAIGGAQAAHPIVVGATAEDPLTFDRDRVLSGEALQVLSTERSQRLQNLFAAARHAALRARAAIGVRIVLVLLSLIHI